MESCCSETAESPKVFLPKKKNKEEKKSRRGDEKESSSWPRRKGGSSSSSSTGVTIEGCSEAVGRTKSLTDDDLDELKGCLDLGFGFSYDEIPDLCSTLPALELCYSTTPHNDSSPPPIANWKFSTPGDDPEEVKARLKYWAQAVACTVKLCS